MLHCGWFEVIGFELVQRIGPDESGAGWIIPVDLPTLHTELSDEMESVST